ncbi:riboflavin synthase [Campylobacter concisus]|uniref:Riboflavin synthase n=1 Tax=Campylobacter concisus TaxID=199 RepID=A0A0M4TNW1_9BACT|nr:riboflavin synthase [Campylobacter concisus]ALF48214.1 6,7-dimethyl-8-ribityllumazine synthase (riboflavin synthase, alpha subunit) [Campylobacter concisus]
MFNGLIREIAQVVSYSQNILRLKANFRPNLGDSIAVNGACLSVIKLHEDGFSVELSAESRANIAVENLKERVHIEPAMKLGDRVDGHLMQGHIDFIGKISNIKKNENGVDFYIDLPREAMSLMSNKGSVGVEGVSLTINEILSNGIRLTIIPITFKDSLFSTFKVGRHVNIESDLLARYVARQLFCKQDSVLGWDDVERISSLY